MTGTAVADCSAQQVVFTVVNRSGGAVTAAIALPGESPFRTVPVPAGEQRVLRQQPGAGPFRYVLAQLEPTRILATAHGSFPCRRRQDQSIPAGSGQPTTVPDVCAVALLLTGAGPRHGHVSVTGGTGFTYTSDAAYTGPDQFDYACRTGEGLFGTVFVQVHAAATAGPSQPSRPPQPVQSVPSVQPVQPVQPTEAPPSAGPLASTGNDNARVAVAGAALVLAGGLLLGALALTRRRG